MGPSTRTSNNGSNRPKVAIFANPPQKYSYCDRCVRGMEFSTRQFKFWRSFCTKSEALAHCKPDWNTTIPLSKLISIRMSSYVISSIGGCGGSLCSRSREKVRYNRRNERSRSLPSTTSRWQARCDIWKMSHGACFFISPSLMSCEHVSYGFVTRPPFFSRLLYVINIFNSSHFCGLLRSGAVPADAQVCVGAFSGFSRNFCEKWFLAFAEGPAITCKSFESVWRRIEKRICMVWYTFWILCVLKIFNRWIFEFGSKVLYEK